MTRSEKLSIGTLSFLLALLLGLLGASAASAHDDNVYWGAEWRSEDRGTTAQDYEFTEQVPGDSGGNFADSVARGGQEWNGISITGADMRFRRNGVVPNYNPFSPCSLADYRNGIHYRDNPDNTIGSAPLCITTRPGTDLIDNFQIVFDPDFSGSCDPSVGLQRALT